MRSYIEHLNIIGDFLTDFKYLTYPIDVLKLCKTLGIQVISYSEFKEHKETFLSISKDGFSVFDEKNTRYSIFYNDQISNKSRVRFTLGHELGHIVYNHSHLKESCNKEEEEANNFAAELLCPQCFLIRYNLQDIKEISLKLDVSLELASIQLTKVKIRREKVLSNDEEAFIDTCLTNKRIERSFLKEKLWGI